jgi:GT2 family glycosyltransferase
MRAYYDKSCRRDQRATRHAAVRLSGLPGACYTEPKRKIASSLNRQLGVSHLIDLSTIVVSFNTRDLLRDCLASVQAGAKGLQAELLVVDNASSDGSAEMVAREFPEVHLMCNASNLGFAAACNIALGKASGRCVVLLNPDTVVSPGALTELVNFLNARPRAGYCGPRLLNRDGSHQPSAFRFPTIFSPVLPLLGWADRFPASRHTSDLHVYHGNRQDFRCDRLCGACLMVKGETIRQVGLLDEGFFMYFEETDWCRRMAHAGWDGWYVASAEVIHLGGQSTTEEGQTGLFHGYPPRQWIRSYRRYARRYHGLLGWLASEAIQIAAYALIWLRNTWPFPARTPNKARNAASAIRHLLS